MPFLDNIWTLSNSETIYTTLTTLASEEHISRVPTEGQKGEEFFTFFFTFHKNGKILHFFLHKNGKILQFFFTKMENFFTFFTFHKNGKKSPLFSSQKWRNSSLFSSTKKLFDGLVSPEKPIFEININPC